MWAPRDAETQTEGKGKKKDAPRPSFRRRRFRHLRADAVSFQRRRSQDDPVAGGGALGADGGGGCVEYTRKWPVFIKLMNVWSGGGAR